MLERDIYEAIRVLDKLDKANLKDTVFIRCGEELRITEEVLEKWHFVGLSNTWFVREYMLEEVLNNK